jgi:Ca2+-binding EF-hand superfamily protein
MHLISNDFQLTKETYFSANELKALYRTFKSTAPSALISRAQLHTIFAEFFKRGDVENYADLIFNAINTSQNGYINFNEFSRTLSTLCRGTSEEKVEFIYRLYDPMGQGSVSWQMILHVITATQDLVEIGRRQNSSPEENIKRAQQLFLVGI